MRLAYEESAVFAIEAGDPFWGHNPLESRRLKHFSLDYHKIYPPTPNTH